MHGLGCRSYVRRTSSQPAGCSPHQQRRVSWSHFVQRHCDSRPPRSGACGGLCSEQHRHPTRATESRARLAGRPTGGAVSRPVCDCVAGGRESSWIRAAPARDTAPSDPQRNAVWLSHRFGSAHSAGTRCSKWSPRRAGHGHTRQAQGPSIPSRCAASTASIHSPRNDPRGRWRWP